ncbi:hypothetical protein O181_079452 [Austropuccinia psidii MF-1]|uniref:CCHC-type domain-containing protein n=1 Tax=Austropuccinia psidii MF-1 TaxID=1389203 RepID=A0A9Q3FJP9_9BASI|nr:hypothetical protein [Austropuccinia psidii MF-1]
MITKWDNDALRYKIENAFENSFFDPDKDKPLTWFLKQVERLNALYREMSQKMVHMKILKRRGGELEHSLRSRCIEACSTQEYINALEDIVTRTKIGRTWKKLDIKGPNKPFIKKDKSKEAFKPNTSNNNEQGKCHKCGGIGHLANNCLKIAKINEIVETEDHNEKENSPQAGTSDTNLKNVQDYKIYITKPAKGMGYTAGKSSISMVMVDNKEAKVNLDTGAYCTCVGKSYLKTIPPDWQEKVIPIQGVKFSSASESMKPLVIIDLTLIFPHPSQCVRIDVEFVAEFNQELTEKMKEKLIDLLFKYKIAFATDKEPLGAMIEHEVDIILNVEKPYPPLLRRPAYPASPRAREAFDAHIHELMDLGILRKVGHNEQVEVTTAVIITWNKVKSRMVGYFRALNTYTIPDIYPIPRIHEKLTQLSQAKFITAMDAVKGFHQNFLTDNAKKLLRIIVHCGIFEYLRITFGIKNAPSHYQRMLNTIFPEELSEGWLIIYIDDIIVFSETWGNHLTRLERVLQKIVQVNMKISLKNCNFAYSKPKALGQVVSRLSLGIDKNKVAEPFRQEFPLQRCGRQHCDNKLVTNVMGSVPVGDERRSQGFLPLGGSLCTFTWWNVISNFPVSIGLSTSLIAISARVPFAGVRQTAL